MSGSLVPCNDCGVEISRFAKVCPQCGGPVRPTPPPLKARIFLANILIIVSVALLPAIFIYGRELQDFGFSFKKILPLLTSTLSGSILIFVVQLYQEGRKDIGLKYAVIGCTLFFGSLALLFIVNFI